MKAALCISAAVVLFGSCQAFDRNSNEMMQKIIEIRDSFRTACPVSTSPRIIKLDFPFGWILKTKPIQSDYIELRHIFGSTALILQEEDDTRQHVAWHVQFRHDERDCLTSRRFTYHLPRDWPYRKRPKISIYGPASKMMSQLTVTWPESEVDLFRSALTTKTAPTICW
jgi:hypothetical protein